MPRSPVISTIPIFALLIVGTVLSAPREEIITQSPVLGEVHETRESEVTRNEESVLHRLASMAKEPLPVANQSLQTEKPTTLSPTTLQHEKVQSNDSESKDMLGTHVTPQDDDDVTSEKATKSNHVRATTIFAPIEFPKNNTDVDIRMATPEWLQYLNQNTDKNNATNSNATNSSATNSNTKKKKERKITLLQIVTLPWTSSSPTDVRASGETPTTSVSRDVTTTDRTITTTTTTTKETVTLFSGIGHEEIEELTTTTYRPTSSTHSPAEMRLHEKKIPEPETMPPGVAAVIAAISFAIIVVVTYIGLLIRRRCVEWRYGNRELLVNDFDAADMTNFEL